MSDDVRGHAGAMMFVIAVLLAMGFGYVYSAQREDAIRANAAANAYRTAIEQSPSAIVLSEMQDGEAVITDWSQGAEEMFGYSREEITGHTLDMLIPEGMRDSHRASVREVEAQVRLRDKNRQDEQLYFQIVKCSSMHKNGKTLHVVISTRAIIKQGKLIFVSHVDLLSHVLELDSLKGES